MTLRFPIRNLSTDKPSRILDYICVDGKEWLEYKVSTTRKRILLDDVKQQILWAKKRMRG